MSWDIGRQSCTGQPSLDAINSVRCGNEQPGTLFRADACLIAVTRASGKVWLGELFVWGGSVSNPLRGCYFLLLYASITGLSFSTARRIFTSCQSKSDTAIAMSASATRELSCRTMR